MIDLRHGDALAVLKTLPDCSVQCCVTSPPYYGLRCYGVDGQIGLEPTPEQYVAKLVDVFREIRRVLRDDGTLWLNLGDSYASSGTSGKQDGVNEYARRERGQEDNGPKQHNRTYGRAPTPDGLKPKDLIGIPWRVAFALQADGWYLRQDLIWCLSGGTWIYARTRRGDGPMMLRDAARLDPRTVKLWNGKRWTQVLGWSRTARNADELELVLRGGERISCTPSHQFPTQRGLLRANEIAVGDILVRTQLPEPDPPKDPLHINEDAAWFAGLYIAEGSMSGDTIQIAGHTSQSDRLMRVGHIARAYGGSATCAIDGNCQTIRVYGKLLIAIINELVTGRTAKDKGLAPVCWRYSNEFLRAILDGYLSGDGHYDADNDRWRIGFTRNHNLERDIRTLAARLGLNLTLNATFVEGFGRSWPAFRGEIRFGRSGHHNEKDRAEVVEIRRSRCREVYDVGVEDEPHLFALACGILTHNSKPSPMPESVADRCTKAHEYVFLMAKSERYFYDATAIAEEATCDRMRGPALHPDTVSTNGNGGLSRRAITATRNRRSVWTVAAQPFPEAHFATFPPKLIEPMILAGTSARGCCSSCGAPWRRATNTTRRFLSGPRVSGKLPTGKNGEFLQGGGETVDVRRGPVTTKTTTGWEPTCKCGGEPVPCTVLDPFVGAGTTALVASRLGRACIGIDLNEKYLAIARRRCFGEMFAEEMT